MNDVFLPDLACLTGLCDETPDTRTFRLRFRDSSKVKDFRFLPGQFIELSVFGYGEAPFCIASSPTRPEALETTVRRTGQLTDALHQLGEGNEVGVRGPFGNGFDVAAAEGKDLLFVAGGIGLPPLRSLIWNVLDERSRFGKVTILYGARTPADLVYKRELDEWGKRSDVEFRVTADSAQPGWSGAVGVVPTLFRKVDLRPKTSLAYVCGPPIMIKIVVQDLVALGFKEEAIISTLERMMQCGIGKCNHCAIGHRYVCRDGPVFSYGQIKELVD
ncbi:NiFe hydrogenase subunit, putative [Candidatus Sulfotelmatobacter kueseliae]|uniref:NiFe hydrogenase subunit, putative n=1 Tax=Candidatus Sulfotelmatobacter kueseliae TaxID=2042962 RepID=A0A2U3L7I1_9BACT|nr:NiFe hydrogenase subunit, putative [Candidatus Sulfotelmatobacter kueseliae]